MVKYAIIAFCLIVLQVLLSIFQINNYRKRIVALRSKGFVGIGMKKGKLKAGSIIIIIVNKEGIIIDCEEMKGRTVFSRFKKANEYIGQDIADLKKCYENDKKEKDSAIAGAIKSVESQLLKENDLDLSNSIQAINN